MGLFKDLKDGVSSAMAPPTPEKMAEILERLPPEKRAKVQAQWDAANKGTADAQAVFEAEVEHRRATQVLQGPAGNHLYGDLEQLEGPADVGRRQQTEGYGSVLKGNVRSAVSGMADGVRELVTGGKVDEITDPDERSRVAAEQRATRDAARWPYLGSTVPAVTISRLPTRGSTQIDELTGFLQASGLADHPERVYGVYRVPDRISPTLTTQTEAGRVVEWDVVHEPGADTGPTVTTVDDAWFPADERWVARRRGEPSVLDEDLALAFCARAGLGPERCLGIARHGEFVNPNYGEESSFVRTFVTGVHVFHAAGAGGDTVRGMAAEAPLALPVGPPPGTYTEVLNAGEVARAVHARPQDPVPVPSPFPYLPANPQELLRMYLEVVGIAAADCYGAQVTVHSYRELSGRILDEGQTNAGPRQPCADGKDRQRIHGAEHVVVTYRDSPDHAEGRDRWAAYQHEVLQAHLERGVHARELITDHGSGVGGALLRGVEQVAAVSDRLMELGEYHPPPGFRYCWPPTD